MLTFFRRIRKGLLDGGRTSKYLLYAVGEIALVVIGILIALQINNWNEWRKDRLEEIELLENLVSDFEESKQRIEEVIRLQNSVQEGSLRLIDSFENQSLILLNPDVISVLLQFGALSFQQFEPVTGTYEALIGAGKIGLISNDSLLRALGEYYADISNGFEDHDLSINLITLLYEKASEQLLPLRVPDSQWFVSDFKPYEKPREIHVKSLMSNSAFFGLLSQKIQIEQYRLIYFQKWLDKILNIQLMLHKELHSKK